MEIYILLIIISICIVLYCILRNPFIYPYFYRYHDITGKRNVDINDEIDKFLCSGGFRLIQEHENKVINWKKECTEKINKSILKKYRKGQFNKILDDSNTYQLLLVRTVTKLKNLYKEEVLQSQWSASYETLLKREEELRSINYECTLKQYHQKNQRKLLTPKLKQKVKIRDNYTCQICGKYMPDEIVLSRKTIGVKEDEDNNCNITIIDDEFGINDAIKKVMERYPEGTELSILEVFELMDDPVETRGKKTKTSKADKKL
ncbi:hypothetical protein SAMN02745111_00311 [Eubacterium uniforme]|uniref:Uncharacterized protein n=1 Tax=Eubacterium uniforme TaxID=39495 RepID=A0A1T4V7P8_9FIRM|nr:hypothetical protein [Eubacterium uniforme]SKA60957.1 hypothetical protein SAMN02745111_00311 [Eubacterium uniforme]